MANPSDSLTVTLPTGEQSKAPPMMGCRACGVMQPSGFRFCRACGAPFTQGHHPGGYLDPLVGAVVGERYRIVARIGSGGMGAVYRVEHIQIGKVAAMKLLHGELSRDHAMVRRFNREARAVSRLTSPHTVSVFDYGRSAGLVYIVMELLAGRDLSEVLRDETRIAPARTAGIVAQVAASLTEAHDLGIVHRDLKPQNIFLVTGAPGADDQVKVLDFGLAKLAEGREESLSADMTQAGVVMGTPYYMSPEQIRDGQVDARSDIYSLGAVVYRLLTGVPAYQHTTPLGVLHMHLNEPVPSMADLDPALAPLDRVVQKAMAKRPGDRYGSVTEFASDLARAARRGGTSAGRLRTRLTSDHAAVEPDRIGTRHEFELFERRLRLRRAFSVFAALVAVLAGAVALYAAAISASSGGRRTEQEPNDDLRSATQIRAGAVVTGAVTPRAGAGNDTDAFRIERSGAPRVLALRVAPDGEADLSVDIVAAGGTLLARSDSAGPGGAEFVPNVTVGGDEAYVLVRGRPGVDDVGGYVLEARFRRPLDREEREPNERVPHTVADSVLGMIGWAGDRDSYWLPGAGDGGRFRIAASGVPGVDLSLEISDRQRTALIAIDEHGAGEGETAEVDIDPTAWVGTPILTVGADPEDHSHLVYELVVTRLPDEAGDTDRSDSD